MKSLRVSKPLEIKSVVLKTNGFFPNNAKLPVILYKGAFQMEGDVPGLMENVFLENQWKEIWRNGIYEFHHFHTNNHETLGVYKGKCSVQVGGEGGPIWDIEKGDVLILPAGVAHKNVGSSDRFACIGAYSLDVKYDMNYGDEEISAKPVPIPEFDPVYGKYGLLFDYWK